MPRNLDSWDGYPAEKNKVIQFLKDNQLKDVIFLTGDTHSSWAIEVATDVKQTYNPKTSAGALAVEFGTTSISSANDDEYRATDTVRMMEKLLLSKNPHIKFLNARDHGYLLLSVYPTHAKAQWYYVNSVREPKTDEYLAATFTVDKGSVQLKNVSSSQP
jgi:alkaline phosphatase D